MLVHDGTLVYMCQRTHGIGATSVFFSSGEARKYTDITLATVPLSGTYYTEKVVSTRPQGRLVVTITVATLRSKMRLTPVEFSPNPGGVFS